MGLQCSITAIGSVIVQWAVNMLGSTAVAAVTAASKTMNLLTAPLESIGTAMATYGGQNLGAARMDRVRQGVRSALLIATIYAIGSLILLHFGDVAIMGLFLDTSTEVDIVRMGQEYLFWNSVFFIPLGGSDRVAVHHPGTWLFHAGHDGRCGGDGRAYGGGHHSGSGCGVFGCGTGQSRGLGGSLPVPVSPPTCGLAGSWITGFWLPGCTCRTRRPRQKILLYNGV